MKHHALVKHPAVRAYPQVAVLHGILGVVESLLLSKRLTSIARDSPDILTSF